MAASIAAWDDSGEVTSVAMNAARLASSLASASPAGALRSAMITLPPAAASRRQVAAPRPEAPPVTRNVWLGICMVFSGQGPVSQGPASNDETLAIGLPVTGNWLLATVLGR